MGIFHNISAIEQAAQKLARMSTVEEIRAFVIELTEDSEQLKLRNQRLEAENIALRKRVLEFEVSKGSIV